LIADLDGCADAVRNQLPPCVTGDRVSSCRHSPLDLGSGD
jgi:hypothetical protein